MNTKIHARILRHLSIRSRNVSLNFRSYFHPFESKTFRMHLINTPIYSTTVAWPISRWKVHASFCRLKVKAGIGNAGYHVGWIALKIRKRKRHGFEVTQSCKSVNLGCATSKQNVTSYQPINIGFYVTVFRLHWFLRKLSVCWGGLCYASMLIS